MHMMVCSEWAGATLPSRVAPQKFCIIMLLSQHVLCRDGSVFVSPIQASDRSGITGPYTLTHVSETRESETGEKENRNGKLPHLSYRGRDPYTLLQP